MKKILFAFLLIFLILSPGAMYSQSSKTHILGIIMGISKYQNMTSLKYADRDAMSFYNFLLSPAGGSADTNNIRLLLNEKATSYNFFDAMDNLLDMANEGDQVYIYFAGHGDIEKKTERQNGFLIGYNAPPNCYAAGGCISVRYLQDYVETLVSRNGAKVTMIIDACRSGKLAGGAEGSEITALALKADWKGVTKILSCQPGETSLEGEKWGGGAGVFSYFLLRGMLGQADKNGDGTVSVLELNNYLDENVLRETNRTQLPEIIGDKRQYIARVNKNHSLDFLNQIESQMSIKPEMQSAGFEADISSINDASVLEEYEKFKNQIKNDNLIAHNDAEKDIETAYSIYQNLSNRRSAQTVINKMKGELLAALQNRAQKSMNDWLEGNQNDSNTTEIEMAFKELKIAYHLDDSTNPQFNQIKFKYLYWMTLNISDNNKKLENLSECLKIDKNNPLVFFEFGYTFYNLKKFDTALIYFNDAIELSKRWSWAWHAKGLTLDELGEYEKALICFDKVIELRQDFWEPWYNKGCTLFSTGKYEEAIKCFDKAIAIRQDNWKSWLNKGSTLHIIGKPIEAIKCFDKAIELKPDLEEAYSGKGAALGLLGKFNEAIKCCDKAIELKPNNFNAWYNKANALYFEAQFDDAIKSYHKAIELKSDDYEAWYNLSCAYSKLKNEAEMLEHLKIAVELNPQYKENAKQDNDFKEYWDDPDFKELVK